MTAARSSKRCLLREPQLGRQADSEPRVLDPPSMILAAISARADLAAVEPSKMNRIGIEGQQRSLRLGPETNRRESFSTLDVSEATMPRVLTPTP